MAQTIQTQDATIIWKEKEFLAALDAESKKRMQMALVFLHNKVRKNVGVTAPIVRSDKVDGTGPLKEPIRVHSSPGEFPRVVTGQGRRRIFRCGPHIRGKRITGDVGTSLDYMIHHELTSRPFLRRTLAENQKKIAQILSQHVGGTKKGGPGYRYSAAEIAQARAMGAAGKSAREIAEATGMSQSHARNVVRGRTRTRGR